MVLDQDPQRTQISIKTPNSQKSFKIFTGVLPRFKKKKNAHWGKGRAEVSVVKFS